MARRRKDELPDEQLETDYEGPSRSEIKREAEALQKAGERLMELPDKQLKAIEMPEELRDAVLLARRIKDYSGLRRQRQYIGRLMRELEVESVLAGLAALDRSHHESNARFHQLEHLRMQLIEQGDSAIQQLLEKHPQADRQQLRQMVRDAKRELDAEKPGKHFRELFKLLRELEGA